MGIKCCLHCKDERYEACWDTCPRYAAEKAADETAKQAQRKDADIKAYEHDRRQATKTRWQKSMYRRCGSAKSWMGGE